MSTEENQTPSPLPMEPIKVDNLLIGFTSEFQRIWDNRRSRSQPCSFWRPTPTADLLPGFFPLGDLAHPGLDSIDGKRVVAVVSDDHSQNTDGAKAKALRPPTDFELVWRSAGSRTDADCTIWRPIPPDGYVALGLVCADRDKPSLNTVRCVRADLVIGAFVGKLIWNDKDSGAKQDFSAWSVQPPAAAAGEVYFAPGSFIGVEGHARPATNLPAYSLRMQIPVQVNPPPKAPTLSGQKQPLPVEAVRVTQIARLPWFTITDPDLPALEQTRTSPFYRMERTDKYILVGYSHNTGTEAQTVKWKVPRLQSSEKLQAFAHASSVEFAGQWPMKPDSGPITFSARLSHDFAHTESTSSNWFDSAETEFLALVAKNKAMAAYLMQSDYKLLRENGTEVTTGVSFTEVSSLYLTEFTTEEEPDPLSDPPTVRDTAP
ncbi:Vps62-related protein [Pseudomonas vancouverensis]|uniref:DUF946 domain-containing protein n=1 Tax=Pseudomonas vancouverensis TaxID=95300 RepID=A0A1H2PBY4_PSEVA|nr:Vps62-related protein [Pseudomonas vancouverensis]KAB0493762.1 DUF946 domain-containing protein [Pseudomonas vancouverensis]TDB67661.1 DUF946 domain-containing protein [Pseudomonas vancouverensis]SDV15208.1 protein of unknown function [Pseudomonas vancouverensis]